MSTAVLMRKDSDAEQEGDSDGRVALKPGEVDQRDQHMTNAIQLLKKELGKRGYGKVEFLCPGDEMPAVPDPWKIAIVTYGMTGLGFYEHYQGLYAVHAYHVSPASIRDAAFASMPPSQRPEVRFTQGAVRRLDWSHARQTSKALRRRAQLMYERLELDVTAQAIMRVRPSIWPRDIVINVRVDPTRLVGPVFSSHGSTSVRRKMGMPADTRDFRRQQQTEALKSMLLAGRTVMGAAKTLGISLRKAQNLRADLGPDVQVRIGRPSSSTP